MTSKFMFMSAGYALCIFEVNDSQRECTSTADKFDLSFLLFFVADYRLGVAHLCQPSKAPRTPAQVQVV